jgi:hypothetical protein
MDALELRSRRGDVLPAWLSDVVRCTGVSSGSTGKDATMLHQAYERMIIKASVDADFGTKLLANPRSAALDAGLSPLLAESIAGLQAASVAEFATLLHRRVYGTWPAGACRPQRKAVPATPAAKTGS